MVRSTSFDTLTHRFFKANSFSNTSDVFSSLTFMMAQNCSKVPASSFRKPNEGHKELLEALISVDLLIDGTDRQSNLELSILFFRTSTGTACVHLDVRRVVHHKATRLRKALPPDTASWLPCFVCRSGLVPSWLCRRGGRHISSFFFVKAVENLRHLCHSTHRRIWTTLEQF